MTCFGIDEDTPLYYLYSLLYWMQEDWNKENILSAMQTVCYDYQVKMSRLYKDILGIKAWFPLHELFAFMGKEDTLYRLQESLILGPHFTRKEGANETT